MTKSSLTNIPTLTTKAWITNLQKLLALGIKEDDILLVKLKVIVKDKTIKTTDKLCTAHLACINNIVSWRVCDFIGSELIIDMPIDGNELGYVTVDMDTDGKIVYVITGCRIIKPNENTFSENFKIILSNTDEIISFTSTYPEAKHIKNALRQIGIKVRIERFIRETTKTTYINREAKMYEKNPYDRKSKI